MGYGVGAAGVLNFSIAWAPRQLNGLGRRRQLLLWMTSVSDEVIVLIRRNGAIGGGSRYGPWFTGVGTFAGQRGAAARASSGRCEAGAGLFGPVAQIGA